MAELKYKRVLLKLSGEALAGEKQIGIDPHTVSKICAEIADVVDMGLEVALVIGGGLVGSETAEFLAEKGCEVTIVELRDGIALDMEYKTRQMLMPKLAALGVVCLTETEVLEIGCNGNVKVKTPYLEKELSGFDTVVVALGYRPDAALCADLAAAGIDFVRVGDCKKGGKIINGVWEAFQITYRI